MAMAITCCSMSINKCFIDTARSIHLHPVSGIKLELGSYHRDHADLHRKSLRTLSNIYAKSHFKAEWAWDQILVGNLLTKLCSAVWKPHLKELTLKFTGTLLQESIFINRLFHEGNLRTVENSVLFQKINSGNKMEVHWRKFSVNSVIPSQDNSVVDGTKRIHLELTIYS